MMNGRIHRKAIALFLLIALCSASAPLFSIPVARAADAPPVEITADGTLEWRRSEKIYLAHGNAVARQGDFSVAADELRAHYVNAESGDVEIERIEAIGNVVVTGDAGEARGDHGIYTPDEGIAILTGKTLQVVTGAETVTARDQLEYHANSRLFVARGAARAQRDGSEVRADTLSAHLTSAASGRSVIETLEGQGTVIIQTPRDVVHSDKVTYNLIKRQAAAQGHVRIIRGEDILTGGRAEVDLATGISRLYSGEDRVRALFNIRNNDENPADTDAETVQDNVSDGDEAP